MKADKKTKEKAKALGISSWHVKSQEKLDKEITEIEKAQTQTVDTAETQVVEHKQKAVKDEVKKPAPEAASTEEECPVDIETLKTSFRGVGHKSPYWKWRHLVNE